MNSNFKWRFPILDGGRVQGINNSGISTFNGKDLYENLAREICQNSLDAKDHFPVIVSFNLKELEKSFYPISSLENIIVKCEEFGKETYKDEKFKEFIADAKECLSHDKVPVMIISDINTKGLDGSKNGTGSWLALTSSDGVTDKGEGSGGSYGIGKNAPFACSRLRSIFYSTYSRIDERRAIQGVASLVTHLNDNEKRTQGFGFFYNVENKNGEDVMNPIFDEDCKELEYFYKEEYGTDVIILGFMLQPNWESVMKKAIVENFFDAIIDKKLIVKIGESTIDDNNISDVVDQLIELLGEDVDDVLLRTKNYITILRKKENEKRFTVLEKDDFSIMIGVDDSYYRTIAYTRGTGMLIRSRPRKKMKAYEAIAKIKDESVLNTLLKKTEPPKHNEWDYKLITNEEESKKAKSALRKINSLVGEYIDSFCTIDYGDSIDPDGISTWLPDDDDSISNKHSNDGEKIKRTTITDIKVREPNVSNSRNIGEVGNGKETAGGQHKPKPGEGGTNHYNPGTNEFGENKAVVASQKGERTIDLRTMNSYRILPISPKNGLWNLVIEPSKRMEKVYLNFTAIRDDGDSDPIAIDGYTYNSKFIKINDSKMGPFTLDANQKFIIKVKLASDERLLLSVGGTYYEANC